MGLQIFDRNPDPVMAARALKKDGAIIIKNQIDDDVVGSVVSDLRAHFDSKGKTFEGDFNGYNTLRISSVLEESRTSADLIGCDGVLEIIDEILLPFCTSYQIGSCTGIEIFPGEKAQVLHRDDTIYPLIIPGMDLQLSVMWALTDFTVENGATQLVPGSHKWYTDREAKPDEVIQMDMPAGSALLYLGQTIHGGGANKADQLSVRG